MDLNKRVKAKELRKLKMDELMKILSETDRTISRFRAGQMMQGSGGMINLPTGKGGGVNWGLFQTLKRNKAVILTVLCEQRKKTKPYGKQMV
jgi:ribosomal protein L29